MNQPSVVEICAGAGGQSLGLHLAGFSHSVAIEIDPMAALTLGNNLQRLAFEDAAKPPVIAVGDVAEESVWNPEDYKGSVDLLAGGVPCPPFSIAGKQLGTRDERDLFGWAVTRAVSAIEPNAVMLENVRGLLAARFDGYRQEVVDKLTDLDYVCFWSLLEARDFGVVQLRPRSVLVALKKEFAPYFQWPEANPAVGTIGTLLEDLMGERGWLGLGEWVEKANGIAPTIVGGSKRHGGADLGPTRAKAQWASLGVDALGVADHAPDMGDILPKGPKLTTAMVARIQGWNGPEYQWKFEGRKTSVYRQIGNAFPPPVARAVGTSIYRALNKMTAPVDLVEMKAQDPLLRVLRERNDYVTLNELADILGPSMTRSEIARRVEHLRHDFDLIDGDSTDPSWKIGEWNAFQGQVDHVRHSAFANASGRGRIS